MKKISTLLTAVLLIMYFSFSVSAITHKEMYMTVEIPEGFVKEEGYAENGTNYTDYSTGRLITVTEMFNIDTLDYSALTDSDISFLEDKAADSLIPYGSDNYFTVYPKCTRAYVNSNIGLKTSAQYFDTELSCEVFIEMYTFSCQKYDEAITFISLDDSTYWHEDCLDSLVIGSGLLEVEKTESYSYTETTSPDSSSDVGDLAYNLGRILGFAAIIGLIVLVIKKVIGK